VVSLTLDNGTPLGSATIDSHGSFTATIVDAAGTSPGNHTIRAVNHVNANGRDATATATVTIQVTSATAVSKPSFTMIGTIQGQTGCPLQPITSGQTDDTVMIFGSGFASGTVTISLDTVAGFVLGRATVAAPGTFCELMHTPPAAQAGKHTLLAVQNGIVAAQSPATFVLPEVIH
jgi:hypothetical protein